MTWFSGLAIPRFCLHKCILHGHFPIQYSITLDDGIKINQIIGGNYKVLVNLFCMLLFCMPVMGSVITRELSTFDLDN